MLLVQPEINLLAVMNLLVAGSADGPFAEIDLHLYQNDVTPTPDSVVGDFTEADFSGYAEAAGLVPGDAYIDLEGNYRVSTPTNQWDHDGGGTANTIYGIYGTNPNAADAYVGAARFPTPFLMTSAADAIIASAEIALRPGIGT